MAKQWFLVALDDDADDPKWPDNDGPLRHWPTQAKMLFPVIVELSLDASKDVLIKQVVKNRDGPTDSLPIPVNVYHIMSILSEEENKNG